MTNIYFVTLFHAEFSAVFAAISVEYRAREQSLMQPINKRPPLPLCYTKKIVLFVSSYGWTKHDPGEAVAPILVFQCHK